MAGFGVPRRGNGGFRSAPRSIPKDGAITVRILPPILSCSVTGEWAVGVAQHFGYYITNPNDDSKVIPKTFECVERIRWENRKKVVTQVCPECASIELQKARRKEREGELIKAGKSKEEIAAALEPIDRWLMRHNRDFKFYVNVKDSNGEFYTLRLPTCVKKDIDALDTKLRNERNLDCLAPDQGVWFVISRTGKGFGTEYKVSVSTASKQIEGVMYETVVTAPLTEEDSVRAEQSCYDLRDVGIPKLSLEKVKRLVESRGDEEVVIAVFGASEEKSPEPAQQPPSAPTQQPAPVQQPVVQQPAAPPKATGESPEIAALMAQIAALQAAQKAAVAPPPAAVQAPVAPPVTRAPEVSLPPSGFPDIAPTFGSDMTEEQFLSQFK